MQGEVLIIGGGLIGSSIAWRLAQKGARVTIADAGNLGGEASPAGAGMLSPGAEFDKPSVWLDLGLESMRLYPAFVEELQAETGIDTDFRMFHPDDGIVDPAALLRALRCACESRNVRIMREQVTAVEPREHAAVVIAAGAWSGQVRVQNVTLPAVVPIKGHLIGFELEPGALGPVRRHGETYVLQRSSGFLIAGSNEQDIGFDRTVDAAICRDIHRRAAQLFPPLEHATPATSWIGFRPRSAEGDAPHVRRVEGTNVWLAYGHYRNGILLTPVTAQRIADEIHS
ncbi:MAG: glycine oxidase ThiO [Bryobacterales bacterium]|jgi:glycine oxidase|nr:glycine oxidase ThiO [Bryobacterales bacterium]